MIVGRIVYRLRQFWSAVYARPSAGELELASSLLTPAQMALFRQMHRSEQAHSIQVTRTVLQSSAGIPDVPRRDLLRAALLHDVGKCRFPVRIWERAIIVLSKAFLPDQASRWGEGVAEDGALGWRRAFVVAQQHAAWGAQMAEEAGASPLVAALIRRHQDQRLNPGVDLEDRLLHLLQAADHEL
jgi:putative nucleotidyltransferase with HDIG domain